LEAVSTLPYVPTIIILVGWVGRSQPPASIGEIFDKGEE